VHAPSDMGSTAAFVKSSVSGIFLVPAWQFEAGKIFRALLSAAIIHLS